MTLKRLVLLGVASSAILTLCQTHTVDVRQPVESQNASAATNSGLLELFEGVPSMEQVVQVDPQLNLVNASPDTPVTIFYRAAIKTPVNKLDDVIEVRDQQNEVVPGKLTLSHDKTFLRFCASEAFKPGRYSVLYRPVQLVGNKQTNVFENSFGVEPGNVGDLAPCNVEHEQLFAHTLVSTN